MRDILGIIYFVRNIKYWLLKKKNDIAIFATKMSFRHKPLRWIRLFGALHLRRIAYFIAVMINCNFEINNSSQIFSSSELYFDLVILHHISSCGFWRGCRGGGFWQDLNLVNKRDRRDLGAWGSHCWFFASDDRLCGGAVWSSISPVGYCLVNKLHSEGILK